MCSDVKSESLFFFGSCFSQELMGQIWISLTIEIYHLQVKIWQPVFYSSQAGCLRERDLLPMLTLRPDRQGLISTRQPNPLRLK